MRVEALIRIGEPSSGEKFWFGMEILVLEELQFRTRFNLNYFQELMGSFVVVSFEMSDLWQLTHPSVSS